MKRTRKTIACFWAAAALAGLAPVAVNASVPIDPCNYCLLLAPLTHHYGNWASTTAENTYANCEAKAPSNIRLGYFAAGKGHTFYSKSGTDTAYFKVTAQPSGASTSIRNAISCELMTYDRITDWFGPSGTTFKTHQCVAYGFGVMSKTWCQIDLNYQECGVWGGTSPGCFGI